MCYVKVKDRRRPKLNIKLPHIKTYVQESELAILMQLNQVTDADGAIAAVAAVAAAVVAKSVRHRQMRERGQFEAEK